VTGLALLARRSSQTSKYYNDLMGYPHRILSEAAAQKLNRDLLLAEKAKVKTVDKNVGVDQHKGHNSFARDDLKWRKAWQAASVKQPS
jgi:hypothetical protein